MSIARARRLRRDQTDAERKLWFALRNRQLDGFKFSRQMPIGSYIADFVCRREKLIIELDGGQHAAQVARDARRTAFLEARGFNVLRFWNNDVLMNMEGVLEMIRAALPETPRFPPHPDPLPRGERE